MLKRKFIGKAKSKKTKGGNIMLKDIQPEIIQPNNIPEVFPPSPPELEPLNEPKHPERPNTDDK